MNLKYKDFVIDRRGEDDRRKVNLNLWSSKIERRKRPDRRMGGLDVDSLTLSEEEFKEVFELYLPQNHN